MRKQYVEVRLHGSKLLLGLFFGGVISDQFPTLGFELTEYTVKRLELGDGFVARFVECEKSLLVLPDFGFMLGEERSRPAGSLVFLIGRNSRQIDPNLVDKLRSGSDLYFHFFQFCG